MRPPFLYCVAGLIFTATGIAQDPGQADNAVIHGGGIEFIFADVDQGRQILGKRDRFTDHMSSLDRQVRMRSSADEGVDAFLAFAAGEVVPWPADKMSAVRAAIESLDQPLNELNLPSINPVVIVHTSGKEESRAAYTRGPTIVLPPNMVGSSPDKIRKLLAHELFHVISRANPELRDRLYRIIGFRPSGKISLPDDSGLYRLTNPDAPVIEHVIRVKLSEERTRFVAPMLYSESPFEPSNPRSLFSLLKFQLMEVIPGEGDQYVAAQEDGAPVFHDPSLPDYHRQIGRNTKYILHPEEIMAVNFSLLVTGATVKDTWIIDRIRETIADVSKED